MIDPANVGRNNGPDLGARRYLFGLDGRQVAVRRNNLGLHHLSDLLLTGDDDDTNAITEADRNRLIAINEPAVERILQRINANLPGGQQSQPGSVRWRAATGRYVFRVVRPLPGGAAPQVIDDNRNFSDLDRRLVRHRRCDAQ